MSTQYTILVVDDDPRLARALMLALEKQAGDLFGAAWNVVPCFTQDDALAFLATNPVDAVATDWKLDEHDKSKTGVHVIEAAKARDPHMVAVLFSGRSREFARYKEAYAAGAYDVIDKAVIGGQLAKELTVKLHAALAHRDLLLRAAATERLLDANLRAAVVDQPGFHALRPQRVTLLAMRWQGFSQSLISLRNHLAPVSTFLRGHLAALETAVSAHGGIMEITSGGDVLAVFGFADPAAANSSASAEQAATAALAIRAAAKKAPANGGKSALKSLGGVFSAPPLGICIHQAEVLAGIVSGPGRDVFTVLGPAVDFAHGLAEAAAEQASTSSPEILISVAVEPLIRKTHGTQRRRDQLIKSVGAKHTVWSLLD